MHHFSWKSGRVEKEFKGVSDSITFFSKEKNFLSPPNADRHNDDKKREPIAAANEI